MKEGEEKEEEGCGEGGRTSRSKMKKGAGGGLKWRRLFCMKNR